MIVSTTTAIESQPVTEYVGVVTGEAVLGANVFRDLFAGLRNIVGGRFAGYERAASSSLSGRARCSRIRSGVILWRCSTYIYPPNIPLLSGVLSLED